MNGDTARFAPKTPVAPHLATTLLKSWFLTILTMLNCFKFFEILNLDILRHFWHFLKFLGQTTFRNTFFCRSTFSDNVPKIMDFWPYLIFCKKSRNILGKLIYYLESYVLFWTPSENRMSGKVLVPQKIGLEWPWLTPFGPFSNKAWCYGGMDVIILQWHLPRRIRRM